jgi:hypothetical protein
MTLKNLTGEMTERFKVHAWKVCVSRESEPRVRIPLSPQKTNIKRKKIKSNLPNSLKFTKSQI